MISSKKIENLKEQIKQMNPQLNGKWMLDHLSEVAEKLGNDIDNEKDIIDLLNNIINHCICAYTAKIIENQDYKSLKKIILIQYGYDPEKDYDRYFEITETTKDDLHCLIDDPDIYKFKINDMYIYSY